MLPTIQWSDLYSCPAASGTLGSEQKKEHNAQINEVVAELASVAGNCSSAVSEEAQVAFPSAMILKSLFFSWQELFSLSTWIRNVATCFYLLLILLWILFWAEQVNECIFESTDHIENKQALDWDLMAISFIF